MRDDEQGPDGTYLDAADFSVLTRRAPLVSIDLVVQRPDGSVLLGKRRNRPAQGFWFVPGGRVRKDEQLDDAYRRIAVEEMGVEAVRAEADWLGVFEHFYSDSMYSTFTSTHYVVLAYRMPHSSRDRRLPLEQHEAFQWWSIRQMMESELVHPHTKAYAAILAAA